MKPPTAAGSFQVVFHFSQHRLFVLQKPIVSYIFQEKPTTDMHLFLS